MASASKAIARELRPFDLPNLTLVTFVSDPSELIGEEIPQQFAVSVILLGAQAITQVEQLSRLKDLVSTLHRAVSA